MKYHVNPIHTVSKDDWDEQYKLLSGGVKQYMVIGVQMYFL
ncbi:hypothetical protein [Lentibacillus kimchii]